MTKEGIEWSHPQCANRSFGIGAPDLAARRVNSRLVGRTIAEGSPSQIVITLRTPMQSDARPMATAWYSAELRSLQEGYPAGFPKEWFWMESVEQVEREWARNFLSPQPFIETWVAELNGAPVGFAQAGPSDIDSTVGVLRSLYVDTTAWDSGVGSNLHGAALAALSASFRRAELFVIEGNTRTRKFYERRGWQSASEVTQAEGGLPLVKYVRSLQ
jgi:RimJ/RimL family protein N-acetyltransferase